MKLNMNTEQLKKGNALLEHIDNVKEEQEQLISMYNKTSRKGRFGVSFPRDSGMVWLSEISEKTQETIFHALNSELVSRIQALEKEFEEL
jgi:hypothetical protein